MKKFILFFALGLSLAVFGAPGNDSPCTPTTAPQTGGCVTGTTTNSTPSMAANMNAIVPCGPAAAQGDDVWYSFVATGTQWAFNLTSATGGNIGVALFQLTGNCTTGTFGTLAAFCGTTSVVGSYSSLTVGNTYYVLVISPAAKVKDFTLCGTSSTPPPIANNTDCTTATPLCNSTTQSGNSNGFGTQELNATNQGCLSFGGEKQSSWYTFTVQTGGTFTMDISPANGTDDYDFALWGPGSACPPSSLPIRCDFAAGGGNTGIGPPGTANSESAGGAKYVNTLNVTVGQTYILLINNFSSSNSPFNLGLGGTASLNCSVLPVELKSFDAKAFYSYNSINWVTGSERLSDYFILETSSDGYIFKQLTTVKGAGNSNEDRQYSFTQQNPEKKINYYRLTEVDINGARTTFDMISVDNENAVQLIKTVNLCGQEVNKDTKGIVFEYYSDGTVTKVYHN